MKKNLPFIFFLLLLLAISTAFLGLIKPYLLAVFWAITFAVMFHQLHHNILRRVGARRNLAASLTLLVIILSVIIPLFLISQAVINQAIDTYDKIETGQIDIQGQFDRFKGNLPVIDNYLQRLGIDTERVKASVNESVTNLVRNASGKVLSLTQNAVGFIIQFSLMLYILFFFLRDGRDLVVKLIWILPLGDQIEWRLLHRFESVTRATVRGSLVVAIVQGTIGGILFWSVGIPAAALWGVLMVVLSLLPLGSGIVWVPAAVIFFTQGEIGKGVVVLLIGGLVIGLVDNLLRPRLVGNDTKLPDYLILLSTLGGLAWFGVSGFILGPIIAAFFITCWTMIGEEYGQGLKHAEDTFPGNSS